jgi:hypothetical protein
MISRPSTDTLLRPRNLDRGRFLPHLGQITVRSLFRSGVIPQHWRKAVRVIGLGRAIELQSIEPLEIVLTSGDIPERWRRRLPGTAQATTPLGSPR